MKLTFILILGLLIFGCNEQNHPENEQSKITNDEHLKTIGVWHVPINKREIWDEEQSAKVSPSITVFQYDGKYITMRLFTEKEWMWKTEDDYYKLKSKWEGNTLYWLPPFADWFPLLQFDGENFHTVANEDFTKHVWKYEKITFDEVEELEKAVLTKGRKPHDYSIEPTSPREWEKD